MILGVGAFLVSLPNVDSMHKNVEQFENVVCIVF